MAMHVFLGRLKTPVVVVQQVVALMDFSCVGGECARAEKQVESATF
jgi:hypothetical protein